MFKVIVAGRGWFAAECLRTLNCMPGVSVTGAFAPDAEDRLAIAALAAGLQCAFGFRMSADHVPPDTDLIVGAATHCFIDAQARNSARLGAIGYHPSLLPRHRGRDAIKWALKMEEKITGGTVYWMDDGADTGPIAAQDWCWIKPTDDAMTLWKRELSPMGLRLIQTVVNDLLNGVITAVEQPAELASWEPSLDSNRLSQL
ncbi:MAG: methionyl-tRNA formyltransferase [Thalassobium sp.]|nr:MAG: methionyl-tRNA formyltransferase [Thalassobium sp.]